MGLQAQIDPVKRHLIQLGYNQPLEGASPLAAYGFYYYNQPGFYRSNLTLRLSVAPVYLDSELGFSQALGERTDFAVGLAGGGFADSHFEMRRGKYIKSESFTGHGGEVSASVYHRFNPDRLIPLNLVIRGAVHYATYGEESKTARAFELPDDRPHLAFRSGLRFGGIEPLLDTQAALELSAWYEGIYRGSDDAFGFANDRTLESMSHLFWVRALFAYTLPELGHRMEVNLTSGTSAGADRFSAYRIGGALPLASEFPLSLPGYFYQELSARSFALAQASYSLPIDPDQRWSLVGSAATGVVDYLRDQSQPGHWHSSLGGGIQFRPRSRSWLLMLGYGYGIDAIRDGGRGAHSVGFWFQYDLGRASEQLFQPEEAPERSRGFFRLFKGS